MCENIIAGIISGVVTAIILSILVSLWNYKARTVIKIQAKRIQKYLLSINNDITWGLEGNSDEYYDSLIYKIPFILQSADYAKEALSRLNFCIFNRRKYIDKQIDEIIDGMESLLLVVVGTEPYNEKESRLQLISSRYQTKCNNILYYRSVFLEKLTYLTTVQTALETITYDEEVDDIAKIYDILKNAN